MRGAVVVLAAGLSRRMGRPKPLLPFRESTFLETILERARAGVEASWYGVVGSPPLAERLAPLCEAQRWQLLRNLEPEKGPLHSIRIALGALPSQCPWLMVILVDQPGVQEASYRALSEAARAQPGQLCVPRYGERRGHPVVFPAACFEDLLHGPLDQGARWTVQRHLHRRVEVEVDDPQVLQDFDTPADLEHLPE